MAGAFGRIIVRPDGQTVNLDLEESYRQIGAHFIHFDIVTTHIDGNGQTVYFDDLTTVAVSDLTGDFNVDGSVNRLDLTDPTNGWEARYGRDLTGEDFLLW